MIINNQYTCRPDVSIDVAEFLINIVANCFTSHTDLWLLNIQTRLLTA